ncbi:DUF5076 domain-containing protein [Methyloversatilis universalis]|uniref:DUF5076 domain-containing protein n=1 Tax=Methyloversatilis universalis TaxID=378211 RepID=UPI0009D9A6D4|nr:DUF5076 domain-containing protein [Methyloversatilis universalis]
MRALVIPPAAQRDDDAVQMLSAWVAERGLHCTMNVGMWSAQGMDEPAAWGTLLADVIRHLSNAMAEELGAAPTATTRTIVDGLLEELNEPTSNVSGGFHAGHS